VFALSAAQTGDSHIQAQIFTKRMDRSRITRSFAAELGTFYDKPPMEASIICRIAVVAADIRKRVFGGTPNQSPWQACCSEPLSITFVATFSRRLSAHGRFDIDDKGHDKVFILPESRKTL